MVSVGVRVGVSSRLVKVGGRVRDNVRVKVRVRVRVVQQKNAVEIISLEFAS